LFAFILETRDFSIRRRIYRLLTAQIGPSNVDAWDMKSN
jgi:hypothetical protein